MSPYVLAWLATRGNFHNITPYNILPMLQFLWRSSVAIRCQCVQNHSVCAGRQTPPQLQVARQAKLTRGSHTNNATACAGASNHIDTKVNNKGKHHKLQHACSKPRGLCKTRDATSWHATSSSNSSLQICLVCRQFKDLSRSSTT